MRPRDSGLEAFRSMPGRWCRRLRADGHDFLFREFRDMAKSAGSCSKREPEVAHLLPNTGSLVAQLKDQECSRTMNPDPVPTGNPAIKHETISLIETGLGPDKCSIYIGGTAAASDLGLLRKHGIAIVVNCAINLDINYVSDPVEPGRRKQVFPRRRTGARIQAGIGRRTREFRKT